MFQACLMVIFPVRWYVLRTTQNGDFVLLPFGVSRLVGAVAPERVVASFLCSRLVSCTCALLWMFILTHATALKPFHSKQSYPLHHLQQGYDPKPLLVLMLDAEIGETDAAAAAQQTPIPVEVNVPVVTELSLA